MEINLTVLELKNLKDAERALNKINCDSKGVQIMKHKAVFRLIKVENIRTKAANLLKQTFLAKGAEVAIAKGSADLSAEYTDALIMATIRQYRQAIVNLKMQPWGLAEVARKIEKILDYTLIPQERIYQWVDKSLAIQKDRHLLVGCIDIAEEGYDRANVLQRASQLQAEGINALEILTEDDDAAVSAFQEKDENIYSLIKLLSSSCKSPIAVKCRNEVAIEKFLACGAHVIDIPGGFKEDSDMASVIAKYKVPVIISVDFRQFLSLTYLMKEILDFLQKNINIALHAGINRDALILSPCGGFFENYEYAFHIIEHIDQLKGLGCPIFINFAENNRTASSLLSLMQRKEVLLSAVALGKVKEIQIFGGREISEMKSLLDTLDKMRRVEQNDEGFN